jgi:hypothetical protein
VCIFSDPAIALADPACKIVKMAKWSIARFSGRLHSEFLAGLYLKTQVFHA